MIIMDLEWNYAAVSPEDLIAGKTLRFEIIQIGAAMVDSRGRILKTFDRLIAPTVHHTIMPKVTELTGITEQKLRGQQTFPSVWQEFCLWSGGEQTIAFWGNCDRAVLLSNLLYFHIPGGDSLVLHDLQALFDRAYLNSGQQTALSSALSALRLTPYGQYHSALSDAVNAAVIFEKLGGEEFLQKNLRLLTVRRTKASTQLEEGQLLLERTFTNITDAGSLRRQFEPELKKQLREPIEQILPGFYRNHKKIWAYRSHDRLIKVTSRSHPSPNGIGQDFVVKFFQIDRSHLDTLRQWSRKQNQYLAHRRQSR